MSMERRIGRHGDCDAERCKDVEGRRDTKQQGRDLRERLIEKRGQAVGPLRGRSATDEGQKDLERERERLAAVRAVILGKGRERERESNQESGGLRPVSAPSSAGSAAMQADQDPQVCLKELKERKAELERKLIDATHADDQEVLHQRARSHFDPFYRGGDVGGYGRNDMGRKEGGRDAHARHGDSY